MKLTTRFNKTYRGERVPVRWLTGVGWSSNTGTKISATLIEEDEDGIETGRQQKLEFDSIAEAEKVSSALIKAIESAKNYFKEHGS